MTVTNPNTKVSVYVDTSGSMSTNITLQNDFDEKRTLRDLFLAGSGKITRSRHAVADAIWKSICENLSSMELQMRTINSRGQSRLVLPLGLYTPEHLSNINIPSPKGGTFLWEFLVNQGHELVQQSDNWMFVLISDGEDLGSNYPYSGTDGFKHCVEALKNIGIDVEFHIIGLGLDDRMCEAYRQVSGATGGLFFNLGNGENDESSLDEVIETINIAIDEAIDPALRARSRRRRQAEYMSSCSIGDLQVSMPTVVVPEVEFDPTGIYKEIGIDEDLNPDAMDTWENSMLSISGHTALTEEHNENVWLKSTSHIQDHRFSSTMRGTWTLDASELAQIARTDIDQLFMLTEQIANSPIPQDLKRLVIRGIMINENILQIVGGSACRILIMPADLPPAPLGWEMSMPCLQAMSDPYSDSGWAILPTATEFKGKFAVLADLFFEFDTEDFDMLTGSSESYDWLPDSFGGPSLKRLISEDSWIGFIHDDGLRKRVSLQFNSIAKNIVQNFPDGLKFMGIRPDNKIVEIFNSNKKLQIEFMNRVDDFLRTRYKNESDNDLVAEYWPSIGSVN